MSEENMVVNNTEHLDSLEERLRQATVEIDNIKSCFSKSTEDLSRIQNMLDVGNLGNINQLIGKYESQVSEAERKMDEAFQGARKYSEELEKEKERLIKLWDAYKNQEEELSTTESKIADLEDKVRTAEESKRQLEQDLNTRITTLTAKFEENESKVKQFDEYKQRFEEYTNIKNQLEEETSTLKDQLDQKTQMINSLQQEVQKAKEFEKYAEYKTKFEDVSTQYEKEKERLTKLYHLYEETEGECKQLREGNQSWQNWFNSNKQIFDKLFSAVPPAQNTPHKNTTSKQNTPPPDMQQQQPTQETTSCQEDGEITETTDSKTKKRRLRFKK